MKNFSIIIILISCFLTSNESIAQADSFDTKYTYKRGDFNGIGKWYMGREIAYVMGFQGINWLERSEREIEEDVSTLIKNMKIKTNEIIADIGAGVGQTSMSHDVRGVGQQAATSRQPAPAPASEPAPAPAPALADLACKPSVVVVERMVLAIIFTRQH